MYKLKYTKEFERDLKKLSAVEQKQTANKLKLLMQNPFYPSLRTKKVQGLDNVFEMSVNMSISKIMALRKRRHNFADRHRTSQRHIGTLTKYQSKTALINLGAVFAFKGGILIETNYSGKTVGCTCNRKGT